MNERHCPPLQQFCDYLQMSGERWGHEAKLLPFSLNITK